MDELIDFLVDVFDNVWRKAKINFAAILTGIIISTAFFILFALKIFSIFSVPGMIIAAALVLFTFIFIKICVMTVREDKINSNTWTIIFQNLINPFIFAVFCILILGALIFTGSIPFAFPDYAEKSYVLVSSIVAGIAALALFPNAAFSLFYSYEGKSFADALSSGNSILDGNRGKMYFLTISLILLALVLNLTYVGAVIFFPFMVMAMDQSKESLIKIGEEKRKWEEAEKNKPHRNYRSKVDYTKSYENLKHPAQSENTKTFSASKTGTGSVFSAGEEDKKYQRRADETRFGSMREKEFAPQHGLGPKPENKAAGEGSSAEKPEPLIHRETFSPEKDHVEVELSEETKNKNKKNEKMVSAAEYETPVTMQEQEEQINLSDFIDLGVLYEDKEKPKESDKDEKNIKRKIENNVEIEIEMKPSEKKPEPKKESKSGNDYLENFGTITKRNIEPKNKQDVSKEADAKSYLEDFGTIKKKK
ncbi:MAG: hypothetical protein FWH43_00935 [Endomicrobia bacterium]|nr:hypothetical protein [Endomicrobiia bacterium]